MIQALFEQYQLQVSELSTLGHYKSFWIRNKIYVLVPVGSLKEEELAEMKRLSDYMIEQGDWSVGTFVPTVQGYYVSSLENEDYLLLRAMRQPEVQEANEGKELAMFHKRGTMFPGEISSINRIGEWKSLWEQRLDQLERFWNGKVIHHPSNVFETLFVDSFPYFLGLAENAIQYVVDTEIDDEPQVTDAATICQHRFTPDTWRNLRKIKLPTDWVYDHPSRDLAEWIRGAYLTKLPNTKERIMEFLYEYEQGSPLSAFGWRLLYARLMFPLHYFETIEGYYLSGSEQQREAHQERLEGIVEDAKEFEKFLGNFYTMIKLPVEKLGIREIDWMKR
ncbi:spore coat putative kinase YutH [Bacillus sp. 165]|uniref:spore coat putative kinase YutH n=1 Tax=Bacillus sp. 165 TaxID=1529117 RepID=UPI001ADD2810|nr:spore coat protein YutH [Bacillus sp. 165]MBO9130701.1 spore coat protein YutH [Bacillus sp. 165]